MILMPQIFDVTANENARYKRNELEWNYEQHLYTHTLIPIINRFASTNEPLKR